MQTKPKKTSQSEEKRLIMPRKLAPHESDQLRLPWIREKHKEFEELSKRVLRNVDDLGFAPQQVLKHLKNDPFLYFKELEALVVVTTKELNNGMNVLKREGYLNEKKMPHSTREVRCFPLTEEGQEALGIPRDARIDPSHFTHEYLKDIVYKFLKRKGREAKKEHYQHGIPGRIDVFCQETNIAYEIERTTKHLYENIRKCIWGYKVDLVVIVIEKAEKEGQFLKYLGECFRPEELEELDGKLKFINFRKFIEPKSKESRKSKKPRLNKQRQLLPDF